MIEHFSKEFSKTLTDEIVCSRIVESVFTNFAEEKIPVKVISGVLMFKVPEFLYHWVSSCGRYIWRDSRVTSHNHILKERWIPLRYEGRYRAKLDEGGRVSVTLAALVARVMYGPRPEKMHVCHTEDRPDLGDHFSKIYYGSSKDNGQDASKNERVQRGEDRSASKLTEEIVIACRLRHNNGNGESSYSLAKEFQVSPPAMLNALTRKTWKYLS